LNRLNPKLVGGREGSQEGGEARRPAYKKYCLGDRAK